MVGAVSLTDDEVATKIELAVDSGVGAVVGVISEGVTAGI